MKRCVTLGALAAALLIGSAFAAEPLKSGPAVGTDVPGPFSPKHMNGPNEGEELCLV
jgi:hypothetical protein